jgi:4-oxalocrotonate tautomerase family enzyme
MPIITVEGPEIEDMTEKRRLVKALTDAALEVFEVPARSIVVILKPNRNDNVACAGELICDRLERTGE